MHASNIDKFGKIHKGKYVKSGKCVFPFKYKKKLLNECIDTGKGAWCATSTKKGNSVDTWGYCVDDSVYKGAIVLKKMSNKKSKRNTNNRIIVRTKKNKSKMQNELLELSKPYQEFKKNQRIKKKIARTIKSNNLLKAKKNLKKTRK